MNHTLWKKGGKANVSTHYCLLYASIVFCTPLNITRKTNMLLTQNLFDDQRLIYVDKQEVHREARSCDKETHPHLKWTYIQGKEHQEATDQQEQDRYNNVYLKISMNEYNSDKQHHSQIYPDVVCTVYSHACPLCFTDSNIQSDATAANDHIPDIILYLYHHLFCRSW